MSIAATHRHQCVICRKPIELDQLISSAAEDVLATGHDVWCHLECANWWCELTDGTPLMSDGWEELKAAQKCSRCPAIMLAGTVAQRVVNPGLQQYDRLCWNCWAIHGAARPKQA